MNFKITIHIDTVEYATIGSRRIPFSCFASTKSDWTLEDNDIISFNIDGNAGDDMVWKIDEEEFSHLNTYISVGYLLLPFSTLTSIGDLIKNTASFNVHISDNCYITGTLSCNDQTLRLSNSNYKFGIDSEHNIDLYDLIETDQDISPHQKEYYFNINNNNNPIEYLDYEHNSQYVFKSQIEDFWYDCEYTDALRIKIGETRHHRPIMVPWFTYKDVIPITLIPNYIEDTAAAPIYWGQYNQNTSNNKKYTYKIWKDNNTLKIKKGEWPNYSTSPSSFTEETINNFNAKSIILDLQAAGGCGGTGNDRNNSFYPTQSGAAGGGGGGFVRCLIDITQYTNESESLQITLTPHAQNTNYKTSILPYSYINLKEGQIRCYNGQPGAPQYKDILAKGDASRGFLIPGGAGGCIVYKLYNNTNKKYFVYTNNFNNPWLKSKWTSHSRPDTVIWTEEKTLIKNDTGQDQTIGWTPLYQNTILNISNDYNQIGATKYYNATQYEIIIYDGDVEHETTRLKGFTSTTHQTNYYGKELTKQGFKDSAITKDTETTIIEKDFNLKCDYYNNCHSNFDIHLNDEYNYDLTSVKQQTSQNNTGVLYYAITNCNLEDFNETERNYITCKILTECAGGCGGNSPGANSNVMAGENIITTTFKWKTTTLTFPKGDKNNPNYCWGYGGYPSNGPRNNKVGASYYYYYGGAGGGGSYLGYGQNGISIYTVPREYVTSGHHTPTDGYTVDTNYYGGGGGGGCYTYYNDTLGNYVYGIDGQPAGFILHW